MTIKQRTDLVLEGFAPRKILSEKALWSDYFTLVADTVAAMRAGEAEKVADLYKQVNLKFNSLEDAEEEDVYNQLRFLDRVSKFLKRNNLKDELI